MLSGRLFYKTERALFYDNNIGLNEIFDVLFQLEELLAALIGFAFCHVMTPDCDYRKHNVNADACNPVPLHLEFRVRQI